MDSHRGRVGVRHVLAVIGAVAVLAGAVALVIAVRVQRSAPQPPASAATFVPVAPQPSGTSAPSSSAPGSVAPASTTSGASAPSSSAPAPQTSLAVPRSGAEGAPRSLPAVPSPSVVGPTLARSLPVRLDIPAIGVHSSLRQLGLNADGTVEVPPLGCDSHAGWYKYSPTPGQVGPAVILGHIDSAACGPAVFFNLGKLRQRDTASVTLADGTVAVFQIEKVVEYKKAEFPTLAVYGNTDRAALRLITCGGTFDPSARSYESNIVVYAALVSSRRS